MALAIAIRLNDPFLVPRHVKQQPLVIGVHMCLARVVFGVDRGDGTPNSSGDACKLEASERSELLDPMRANCWISAQH